jgi:hypothetical protein
MPHNKTLSDKMQQELAAFFEYTPPARLSRNLRNLLLGYLMAYHDGHSFDIDDLLTDLTALFQVLDTAAEETT